MHNHDDFVLAPSTIISDLAFSDPTSSRAFYIDERSLKSAVVSILHFLGVYQFLSVFACMEREKTGRRGISL